MIAVGTLCLLVSPHPHAGEVVTVVGATFGPHWHENEFMGDVVVYLIAKQDGRTQATRDGRKWGAQPHELIPITPPGITTDERDRAPVSA